MLKGLRFQKRLSVLPGLLRINLSKSGASASVGPRGADVNIGPHGVTTNAGIPGTGLSYRQKAGGGKIWIAILTLSGGLAVWGFQHWSKVERMIAPAVTSVAPVNTAGTSVRYVHREGAVIRDEAKASGHSLKKEAKGAQVTLIALQGDWAQVQDGPIKGWMRASVLGAEPPQ